MSTILLFQLLVTGIINGLILALSGTGFSLIFGHARIMFFAIGEIYMLGGMLTWFLHVKVGIPFYAAVLIVIACMGLFGAVLERYLFRYLEGKDALTYSFVSFAVGMLIVGFSLELFGERSRGITSPLPGSIEIFGVGISNDKLLAIVFALIIIIGLTLFFKYAKAGRAIRAVSEDSDAAQLVGININTSRALTFFLALSATSAAGALIAPIYYVNVFSAPQMLSTTLIVVVLGGLGSIPGAIAGGLSIGLLESFGYAYWGGITSLISFFVVIVVLMLRPQGILGKDYE